MGNSDSRTLFRDQVQQLVNAHLTADTFDTWSGLFVFPESAEDVLSMFPASDVRMLITDHPWNIRLVVDKALEILEGVKDADSSYALEDFKHASNAARILSRIVPVTLEAQVYDFYRTWWSADRRGVRMLNAALGFVLEASKALSLASAQDLALEGQIDGLRLLLATISEPLFRQRTERDIRVELWHWILSSTSLPLSSALMTFALHSSFTSSIPKLDWLPYVSRLRSENSDLLSQLSLQVLLALLFYPFPEKRSVDLLLTGTDECSQACREMLESQELASSNAVITAITDILDLDTLELVASGVTRVLRNYRDCRNTYLPGSLRSVSTHIEVVYFLYCMLVHNDHFLSQFAKTATAILVPLLDILEEKMPAEESSGILCAGIVALLRLSTDRDFCLSLNQPCTEPTPVKWPVFTGTLADALVLGICQLIQDCPNHCHWLLRDLTRILANA